MTFTCVMITCYVLYSWDGADASKSGSLHVCCSLPDWFRHDWGFLPWEGGQVLKSSLSSLSSSSLSSSFCRRYDSDGNYLGSLPDLATVRVHHTCATFLSNGEQVKISTSCAIIFLLYFNQALLVAGGRDNSHILSSTEIFSEGTWTAGGDLPR